MDIWDTERVFPLYVFCNASWSCLCGWIPFDKRHRWMRSCMSRPLLLQWSWQSAQPPPLPREKTTPLNSPVSFKAAEQSKLLLQYHLSALKSIFTYVATKQKCKFFPNKTKMQVLSNNVFYHLTNKQINR